MESSELHVELERNSSVSTKKAVAIVIRDHAGDFLAVKRSDDDESLPGLWGLPAVSLIADESVDAAIVRAGRQKLGVDVKPGKYVGEDSIDRGSYRLQLAEYEADVTAGVPSVPQPDGSVSQYSAMQFSSDPTLLVEAARRGSLCSRVFLRSMAVDWSTED